MREETKDIIDAINANNREHGGAWQQWTADLASEAYPCAYPEEADDREKVQAQLGLALARLRDLESSQDSQGLFWVDTCDGETQFAYVDAYDAWLDEDGSAPWLAVKSRKK